MPLRLSAMTNPFYFNSRCPSAIATAWPGLRVLTRYLLVASLGLWLASCDSDLQTNPENVTQTPSPPPEPGGPASANGTASNSAFTLQVGTGSIDLVEGAGAINIPVTVTRNAGQSRNIVLSVQGESESDERLLSRQFADADLAVGQSNTDLTIRLDIGPRPLQPQTRMLRISASDGSVAALSVPFMVRVTPTSRPDIYLLIGQSNMIGFSEDESKQADIGEIDAPDPRIRQLNVTGNDDENFSTAFDFTNPQSLFNTGVPVSLAVDPLHDGFDSTINGKAGTRIGPALSFAKRALADTGADIILVPAAWSDTGFCRRSTNRLPGIGWNATTKSNPAFSGTLLHDRAIARTNIALQQTGGILRGILWHQGEADSDDIICAQAYAANLVELAESLRSNINQDARGAIARGVNSDVPFIAGTMSMGRDSNSDQTPFSDRKLLVDGAHRNVGALLPMADFVNNDDLVPAAFPCGEGSCIHFGAAAYREMGKRYYERLVALLP